MGNKRKTKPKKFNLDPQIERLLEEALWLNFICMYESFGLDLVQEFVKKIHVNVLVNRFVFYTF